MVERPTENYRDVLVEIHKKFETLEHLMDEEDIQMFKNSYKVMMSCLHLIDCGGSRLEIETALENINTGIVHFAGSLECFRITREIAERRGE